MIGSLETQDLFSDLRIFVVKTSVKERGGKLIRGPQFARPDTPVPETGGFYYQLEMVGRTLPLI